MYGWASIGLVFLLVLVFMVQLMHELRTFATLKAAGKTKDANEQFFFSFVGSIIYGSGELKGAVFCCFFVPSQTSGIDWCA